jgi:hypothetical protein
MEIICFGDTDKRRRKNKCKKMFTCFLPTYAQRLTAAPIIVTYNDKIDKGGRDKRESNGIK